MTLGLFVLIVGMPIAGVLLHDLITKAENWDYQRHFDD